MTHRRLSAADGVSEKTVNAAREEIIMEKKPFVTREKLDPFYIYDEEGLRENIREINKAFSWNPGFREYFAVKAEPNPVILSLLLEEGCGCDCSSMTELVMAKAVGCDGEHIMFSSNDTPDEEYVYADKIGAIVNLDDFTMIESYAKAVGKFPKTMCCRYNPGGIFKVSNGIMDTPGDAKYGMTTSQLFDAFRILKENGVENFGIHSFLVSNAVTNEYYPMLAKLLFELAVEVQRETGVTTVFVTHDQEEAMSISDLIVVMEAGVVQQIAKPQLVYEDPINLFVAKFLGTPPINVFEGEVKNGIVYIGGDAIIKAEPDSSWKEGAPDAAPGAALKDGPVTIGIRPEGFDPEKDGELRCGLVAVEVMGRDTSIVATNANAANGQIRTIVSTEELSEVSGETVNFRIKPSRIYLFDHETGARVRCCFTPLR